MERHDRAIVVTGASSGIGEACALRMHGRGYRVFAGVRNDADGARLRAAASDRLTPVRLDVIEPDSISAAAAMVRQALGSTPLVGLVNNAGIAVAAPLEFLPLDALRRQLEVNVTGQVAVTQAFLPMLRPHKGRIVNVGSVSGRFAAPLMGPYSASKFALEALSDSLRVELRPWGMHVAIVEPGVIDTPIWKKGLTAADAMVAEMPAEVNDLYGGTITRMRSVVEGLRGIPAERVADAVEHALTAPRPKARYVVGADAHMRIALGYLPTRLRDWLVARALAAVRPADARP